MNDGLNVGVIGLGSMGMGVAKSCIDKGIAIYGADLDQEKLADLQSYGAKVTANNLNTFADQLDLVILLVINAKQVKQILFGEDGLASHLKKNAIVMVSSTISPDDAKEIDSKLQRLGLRMLDAPVSGGAAKANIGKITIMAAGKADIFDEINPVLNAIAENVYQISCEIGAGATVKVIHQLLAGVHIAVAAEAMAMAAKANIPLDIMYEVVNNAAGHSWMFENRMKHVIEGDYTPLSMVDIFVKDLNLVADTAKSLDFKTILASKALEMFQKASEEGYGKEDDSAVIKIFPNINLPKKEA